MLFKIQSSKLTPNTNSLSNKLYISVEDLHGRMSYGTFSAALFFQCLKAIGGTDNVLKDIPEGFIKEGWGYIKLDWSNQLKKYNELLTPKPQSIYRVGGLTFFDEQSAKNYVGTTTRPCDIERTDSQFVM